MDHLTEEQQMRMAMASEIIERFPVFAKGKDSIDKFYNDWFKVFTDIDLKLFVPSMIHFNSMSFDFIIDPIIRGKVKHIAHMDIHHFKEEMKRRGVKLHDSAIVNLSEEQAQKFKTVSPQEAIQILSTKESKN